MTSSAVYARPEWSQRRRDGPAEVTLFPANAALRPVTDAPEEVAIQGVLVGQLRAYG